MRTLWARLRAAWVTLTGTGAAASVAFSLLVLICVLASLAIPRESTGLRDNALRTVIATSQPRDRDIIAAVSEPGMLDQDEEVVAGDIAAVGASFRSRLTAFGVPLAASPVPWAGLTTGFQPSDDASRAAGYADPQFEVAYRTDLSGYSRLVAGRFPAGVSSAGNTQVAQAAVTTATATRFGLRVGSVLNAGALHLMITGVIRPADPAAGFWNQDLVAARPEVAPGGTGQPPFWLAAAFVGPGSLPLVEDVLNPDAMLVTWMYPVALNQVTAGHAAPLETSVSELASSGTRLLVPDIASPVQLLVSSKIPAILSPFIAGENAAAPVLELLFASLAVLGAVVVLLGARLVAQHRAEEFTLMRARGAALHQLGWLVLRASVIIAAAAGAAGAALAVVLTPGDGDPAGWWLAGITVAVTLIGPVLIGVAPQRVAAPAARRPGGAIRSGARRRAARRIVIEVTLAAAAVGGVAVLRSQGLSSGNSGLFSSVAPVLVAIPVAIAVLRCYPFIVRELARIAGLSRGAVAFIGLARAARTPPGTFLPSFALILVLAMVAFPDMVSAAETSSQVASSWQQVGADAVVQAPAGQAISPALQRQIESVPGVVSTATAVVEGGSLPDGSELSLVFVDPSRYATVIDGAPGPRFPLAALSGSQAAAVPVVATPAAASLTGAGPVVLGAATSTFRIRVAGRTADVPGVGSDALVMPVSVLGPSPAMPGLELIAGPGLNVARLNAVVRRGLPDGVVTSRASTLAALAAAPVPRAAQTALTMGMAAAAGFGVLVLLLSLLLAVRTREMTLARLATMGLRCWQAQLLLAAEALPPVVAAGIGGIACAWLLAPLVGPALNLAAFSGAGSPVGVTPALVPLVASAGGLVLAALLALAAQAMITYRRGSARALRIAD